MLALVDCNNFYASCEATFDPRLRGVLVVVLSNNDGCVIARSAEAKALGVPMGIAAFEVEGLFKAHGMRVLSSNFALYDDMSRRVMSVLAQFTPRLELYSIDEAFLDLAGCGRDWQGYGLRIRERVRQWTGLPVSVGIAPTKVLCKCANKQAKRGGSGGSGVVALLNESDQRACLEQIEVGEVWGIGAAHGRRLRNNNINTAWDLRNADLKWIRKRMGIVGARMVSELRGEPCMDFETQRAIRKQIGVSRTFKQAVKDRDALERAVAGFATRAAEKLRADGSAAGSLSVFVRTDTFRVEQPQYSNACLVKLDVATQDTGELIAAAKRAVCVLYRFGYQYKQAGIWLGDLAPAEHAQPLLFEPRDRAKGKRLMQALDRINKDEGSGCVRYAAEGYDRHWVPAFLKRSPRYTTRWDELPVARC